MARYRNELRGVFDTVAGRQVVPQSGQEWFDYLEWLRQGNTPDPYVPPTIPAETLAQAKKRRIAEIKRDGMAHIQTKFPAIRDFDTLQLLREIYLSIAPAARAPTTDWQWLVDHWLTGSNAVTSINAATTIAQVDAVSVTWPA